MSKQNSGPSEYNERSFTIRGRDFSIADLEVIKRCVQDEYERGRTHISKIICERLDWRQPNGWLKDRACRDVLRELESKGFFELPPPLTKRRSSKKRGRQEKVDHLAQYELETPITDFPSHITLTMVKGSELETIWNELVDKHHYLGHTVTVGRYLKYLIRTAKDDRILGAISFSSPAWRLSPRDELLQLIGIDIDSINSQIIENDRFLILPHVRVKNLASKVLSMATAKVVEDWLDYYALTPQIAETFVNPSMFEGTCYKAANWIEIGYTKGYAKKGASHHNSREPKAIFLYGLNTSMRNKLLEIAKKQNIARSYYEQKTQSH